MLTMIRRQGIPFALALVVCASGCGGGGDGAGNDLGDVFVLSHSPGNGDQLNTEDSMDQYNALDNPTLVNPGAVTVVFTESLDPASVRNPDPSDPQGTRNVRLFYFDTSQGPYDPFQPTQPGVNPPGAHVLVPANTILTQTNRANDTLIIRPTGLGPASPLPEGQYSVNVELGVRGADGSGMKGAPYFFFFRVGPDTLGPAVIRTAPANGEKGVDPTSEIRITLSETILASTVNSTTLQVTYQPTGAPAPTAIPGNWYTDGGNSPGNNFPALQLNQQGQPGSSGTSPRNGVDLVFRPDRDAFPTNMIAEDPNDPECTLVTDPPRKGNRGYPLGQAVTVRMITQGQAIVDTAGNPIPDGSPNTTFTFEIKPKPAPIFAPIARGAIYYGDTIGVGVIEINPVRSPYMVGPSPPRAPDSVVTRGTGLAQTVVRVPVPELVDIKVDTRPYTAFYTFVCSLPRPTLYWPMVYAATSKGGGEVVVIDSFRMEAVGRFATPTPGGMAVTALGTSGYLMVSNFSANTVTVFDIGHVAWYDLSQGLWATQAGLMSSRVPLILNEKDFAEFFPHQRPEPTSPPGPPILGTVLTGIGPTVCDITEMRGAWGVAPAFGKNVILGVINSGENTLDVTQVENLGLSVAIEPDLRGLNLSSTGTDIEWTPVVALFGTGRYFAFISTIGGSMELFLSGGGTSGPPSVKPHSSRNWAPNKIVNSLGGLMQPTSLQYVTDGNGISTTNGFSAAVLVAETGKNRIQQIAVIQQYPSNLMQVINDNYPAGLGPVDITGDPTRIWFFPNAPRFGTYYAANAGDGTVTSSEYLNHVIRSSETPVPGVHIVSSWWSQ